MYYVIAQTKFGNIGAKIEYEFEDAVKWASEQMDGIQYIIAKVEASVTDGKFSQFDSGSSSGAVAEGRKNLNRNNNKTQEGKQNEH